MIVRTRALAALALLLPGACAATHAVAVYEPASAVRQVEASATYTALVSAADPRVADAGREILARGGSAADAALAVMLALTVVEPQSSGLGGGSFILHHDAKDGLTTIDGREAAPLAATPTLFLGPDGKPLPFQQAVASGRSVGVPGNLAAFADLHARQGRLPWKAAFQPAIRLARDGYTVSPRMAGIIALAKAKLRDSPELRALYLEPDGSPKATGAVIRNPALAAFLEEIAAGGIDAFYRGAAGARFVAAARAHPVAASTMTMADLATYRPEARPPVCGSYRGWRICGMAPPSSGGVGVLSILKQIERFDMAALGPDSPVAWHLIAESMRLAYADRAKFIADPAFVAVPVAGLASPAYHATRSTLIAADRTMASAPAGEPDGAPRLASVPDSEVSGTSHFAIADRFGDVVSVTSTVESIFGSGIAVDGYVLNNELTDFNFQPDLDGVPAANRVEGGKRPRSTMSPAIVYTPDGKVAVAIGAAGGPTIMAQVAKALIGVIDWHLPVQDAIALPQVIGIGNELRIEKDSRLVAMVPALTGLGQKVSATTMPLKANAVQAVPGGWKGGADPRSEGALAGLK